MIMSCRKLDVKVYPKTVYTDLAGLPDPVLLGLTIHYYNHSDQSLYMKIFISGPSPWSSNAVQLGSLGSGSDAYVNLDNFTSRTKPSQETTEELTLTLRGYNDSGYSELLYEFSRSLTVVFIKSDDGSWTTDVNNDFSDGTVQGWATMAEAGSDSGVTVHTDYVLSPPYSIGNVANWSPVSSVPGESRLRIYKSFTTPNKSQIFGIVNFRTLGENYLKLKYIEIRRDSTVLIHIGRTFDMVDAEYAPEGKWMRIVVPLPANTTFEFRIILDYLRTAPSGLDDWGHWWLDDFKIISK